jgi:hypothetical protein
MTCWDSERKAAYPGCVGERPQGWYRDPFAIHEERYFSEGWPTKLVRDAGTESYDLPPDGEFFDDELVKVIDSRTPSHDFSRPHRISLDEPFDAGPGWRDDTGWYRDPYGIHQDRYMSGGRPTPLVRDDGNEAHCPPPDESMPPGRLVPAADCGYPTPAAVTELYRRRSRRTRRTFGCFYHAATWVDHGGT